MVAQLAAVHPLQPEPESHDPGRLGGVSAELKDEAGEEIPVDGVETIEDLLWDRWLGRRRE